MRAALGRVRRVSPLSATRIPAMLRGGALVLAATHLAIVARLLGRDQFGDFAGAFALAGIAVAVAEFGLTTTGVIAVVDAGRHGARRVAGQLVVASAMLTAAAIALTMLIAHFTFGDGARTDLWLLLPWAAFRGLQPGFVALRRGAGEYGRVATAELAGWALTVAASAPLIVVGDEGARRIGIPAALAAGAVLQLVLIASRVSLRSTGGWHGLLAGAMPLGVTNALSTVHVRIDQVVLAGFGLSGALAAYAVSYRVFDAVLGLVTVISGVSFAVMARTPPQGRAAVARMLIERLAWIAALVGAAAYLLAPVVVRLLGGDGYGDGTVLVRLLIPALVAAVLNTGAAQAVIAGGRRRALLFISAAGVGFNLGINLLLIPRIGAAGAATATSITEVLGFLLVARAASLAMPRSIPFAVVLLPFASVGAVAIVVEVVSGGPMWWVAGLPVLGCVAGSFAVAERARLRADSRLDHATA